MFTSFDTSFFYDCCDKITCIYTIYIQTFKSFILETDELKIINMYHPFFYIWQNLMFKQKSNTYLQMYWVTISTLFYWYYTATFH